jgi:hypothetical protein
MTADTARLLGVIGQLIIGLAILLVVWMLSRTTPPTSRVALRRGWFVVAVLGLAVVVLAAVRLPAVL